MKSVETLVKKCPNIQTLKLILKNNKIFESIVPLITKYCDYLNEFNVSFNNWRIEPKLNEEFVRKFSSNLKYISCGQKIDFNLFPNFYSVNRVTATSPERFLGLNLKNMKKLNIALFEDNEHLLSEVLQKFHKISHLSLYLNSDNENSVFNAFKESPVLQNLIELKYYRIRC